MRDINQWSSTKDHVTAADRPSWVSKEHQDRLAAYAKYDQLYWNDPHQYSLRTLEGEQPLYIPTARAVVDTTAHYLMKGLNLSCEDKTTSEILADFLKREAFYSRFDEAKIAGVARGDWIFHLTANPKKSEGTRLSLTPLDPSIVFPIFDEDKPDYMIGCHIAEQYYTEKEPDKTRIRRLTYRIVEEGEPGDVNHRRISREESIFEIDEDWWGPKAKLYKKVIPYGLLDPAITSIPIYWFKNRSWTGEEYGSSELRGLEAMIATISQGDTDVSASLALEGLGVYATDGGRPVDENGVEVDWEVAPGRVMEVPSGSYFRRVEGVSSITPATDQIKYIEEKINLASGISDVALGKVDAQVAQSGIALAIKFMPTLAKIETRDRYCIDILTQLFYDWKIWYGVFEHKILKGDIIPQIGDKLPLDRTGRINELNNMIDRKLITKQFYRDQMALLGYVFPEDLEAQLKQEAEEAIQNARAAFLATKDVPLNEEEASPSTDEKSNEGDTLPTSGNRSNNRNRVNESNGTEATDNTRDA